MTIAIAVQRLNAKLNLFGISILHIFVLPTYPNDVQYTNNSPLTPTGYRM